MDPCYTAAIATDGLSGIGMRHHRIVDQIDAHPLLSRCIVLPLARRDICEPLARRAQEIAIAEGLDGKPIAEYIKLLRLHKNNLRAAIQDIETGAMMD